LLVRNHQKLKDDYFTSDVLELAPDLLGKILVLKTDKTMVSFRITETEAYRGEEDLACHARKGRTKRTDPMYYPGGILYIYLIYGMYWMMNIVAGEKNIPQAVLIRGLDDIRGPGKVTKTLGIVKSFNYENLSTSKRIYLLDDGLQPTYSCAPRVGIDYAGEHWKNLEWRFIANPIQ
jgi:DNA-3-methyladenine glycosylase